MRFHRLSDAVSHEGWTLLVTDNLDREDGLGEFFPEMNARACKFGVLAVRGDCWDYAYSASHEIAEAQHGFTHTVEMAFAQANILARWLKGKIECPAQNKADAAGPQSQTGA